MSRAPANTAAPYRPDIDGLRAISVAAVILFHADLPGAEGGFVGVDVFFVISGYLITQWLLLRDAVPGAQLLREFYVRRVRRILPALLLMLFVSSAVALWLLQPADLVRFGKYLTAAAFMTGNFAALGDGDYFGGAIGFAPLLHLWSIAVEEQFYLLYPLLLLGLRPLCASRRAAVLAVLAAVSLLLCIWGSAHRPVANFYIGITRGWELLLGALAALGSFDGRRAARHATALAVAGLAAVVGSAVYFRRDMNLPGVATLLPAGGTVLLLVAGRARENAVGRALAWAPLVSTGRASYSLYLWHLPLIVFGSYWMIAIPRGPNLLLVLILIVLIAFASWSWFEEPLRRRQWLKRDDRFLAATLAGLIFVAALGAVLWSSEGLPGRLSAGNQRLLASATLHPQAARCMTRTLAEISSGDLCRFGSPDPQAPRVVLWGDSHALALLPGLEQLATRDGFALFYAGRAACRPLLPEGAPLQLPRKRAECDGYNAAMREALRRLRPDDVLLAAFWALPEPSVLPDPGDRTSLADSLRSTSRAVQEIGARVCVVRDLPVLVRPVAYGLVMARRRGLDGHFLGNVDDTWQSRDQATDSMLLAVAASEPGVRTANPRAAICGPSNCEVEESGQVLFRDSNHLSVRGALRVAPTLQSCFPELRSVHARRASPGDDAGVAATGARPRSRSGGA